LECVEIRDRLLAGELPEGAAFEAHLEGCAACRELVSKDARLGRSLASAASSVETGPELLDQVEKSLSDERGLRAWLRSRPTSVRLALSVWLVLLILTVFVLTRRRVDFALYPELRRDLLFALFGLGVFFAALRALTGVLRPRRRLQVALALGALGVPVLAALLPRAHVAHSASLEGTIADFAPRALGCFGMGALASAPLVVLLVYSNREDRITPLTAAFAAASAGFAANLVLHAHCAITDPAHLALGHALVGLVWWLALSSTRVLSRAG